MQPLHPQAHGNGWTANSLFMALSLSDPPVSPVQEETRYEKDLCKRAHTMDPLLLFFNGYSNENLAFLYSTTRATNQTH